MQLGLFIAHKTIYYPGTCYRYLTHAPTTLHILLLYEVPLHFATIYTTIRTPHIYAFGVGLRAGVTTVKLSAQMCSVNDIF